MVRAMGYMDEFAVGWVTPQLQPGEQIQWIACLAHPVKLSILLTPERYEHFIGIATDRRLIVVEGVTQLFSLTLHGKLKPEVGKDVHVWWYNELGAVRPTVWSVTGVRGFAL